MSDSGRRVRAPVLQADHVHDVALGGAPEIAPGAPYTAPEQRPRRRRRSPALRVLDRVDERPVAWEPRAGVPAGGRAECRHGERPCPYVRCEWHLWLVLGSDRAGRRWDGKPPATTLLPAWLEYPTPPCCTLDVAEAVARGAPPVSTTAAAMHMSSSTVWLYVVRALRKLRASGVELRELIA